MWIILVPKKNYKHKINVAMVTRAQKMAQKQRVEVFEKSNKYEKSMIPTTSLDLTMMIGFK